MAIVTSAVSIIVYNISTYELPNCTQFKSLTFRKKFKVVRYNIADYVILWQYACHSMAICMTYKWFGK